MAKPISGKQCQKARNLLKWNQRDLATRCAVDMKRIDSFEKGVIRPYKGEMDAIITAFDKEDVQFKENFEVQLKSGKKSSSGGGGGGGHKEQETYDATEDFMSEVERQQKQKAAE